MYIIGSQYEAPLDSLNLIVGLKISVTDMVIIL